MRGDVTEFRNECVTCNKSEPEVLLSKCSVCLRYYCDAHRFLMSGREFCGQRCGKYFFFPEEEET